MSALPRQMNQTRGQFSGASGSSTARPRSPERRRSTTCSAGRVGCAGLLGLARHLERALRELREERHPAHADGLRLEVDRVPLRPLRARRHRVVVGELGVVAPLVALDVVPRRRLLLARRLLPVERERERDPRRHQRQLLLADVVVHAAAVDAAAAAEDEGRDRRPVGEVVVVPVVDPGADDHHRLALRPLGVGRELAREADDRVAPDARVTAPARRACRAGRRRSSRGSRPSRPRPTPKRAISRS